jgi:acetyl esterase
MCGSWRLTSRSVVELGHQWGLNVELLRWAIAQWLPPTVDPADPAVSPLLADLTGLPSTVVITADHDPLRDEGDALAAALVRAQVSVVHRCEEGMVHSAPAPPAATTPTDVDPVRRR